MHVNPFFDPVIGPDRAQKQESFRKVKEIPEKIREMISRIRQYANFSENSIKKPVDTDKELDDFTASTPPSPRQVAAANSLAKNALNLGDEVELNELQREMSELSVEVDELLEEPSESEQVDESEPIESEQVDESEPIIDNPLLQTEEQIIVEEEIIRPAVTNIEDIKKSAKTPPNDLSTQQILKQIKDDLQSMNVAVENIKINSELAQKAGKYELKTFTIPGRPDELFYKIEATYSIIANIDGIDEVIDFKRDIFTSAKTPEMAILAAAKFKDTVTQLVLDPTVLGVASQDVQKSIKQRSFQFKFSTDASGKPRSLSSIHLAEIELKPSTNPDKVYVYNFKTCKGAYVSKSSNPIARGDIAIYATEEQAILHSKFSIEDKDIYERLEKTESLEKHIAEIKEDIDKKIKEFADIKERYIKEPYIRLFGSKTTNVTTTKAFAQYIADVRGEDKNASPNLVNYIKIKKELESYKADHGSNQTEEEKAEINRLETQLKALQLEVSNERAPFDEGLPRLRALNEELQRNLEQLEQLDQKAQEILDPNRSTSSPESKKTATVVQNSIFKIDTKKLQDKIIANNELIDKIVKRLEPLESVVENPRKEDSVIGAENSEEIIESEEEDSLS